MSRGSGVRGRAWSGCTTALLLLLGFGALPACGPDAEAAAPAVATASAAPVAPHAPPPGVGACRRFTTCVPQNPCHTGWVTGCRANVPICTDIGGWLSNGTTCGSDQVCYMGECVPCPAGDACQPTDAQGNPIACRAGAIACGTGQPACVDTGPASDGSACWPGSEPYWVCAGGECRYCPSGEACQPSGAPCHRGAWSCQAGPVCQDTGEPAPDGTWCGPDQVCSAGECVACQSGQPCEPAGMPCMNGSTDCSSGAPVCQPWYAKPEGTACGDGLVCDPYGQCVTPCVNGDSCTPTWNPCRTGTKVCYGPTSWYCQEGPPVADGTSCGSGQVCLSGSCTPCGTGCASPDACHGPGQISCATGRCEPGDPFPEETVCGVGGETCRSGACTGVPGGPIVVRSASGAPVDLTGTTWAGCYPGEPEPGASQRRTESFGLGSGAIVEETFASPDCSGEPTSRLEISGTAVTAGDRVVTWGDQYPPDGLPYQLTATAIAISAILPGTGEPLEIRDLRFVNDWTYPRRIYLGSNESAPGPGEYPTRLSGLGRTEVLACTPGEPCQNPYGACEEVAVDCSAGYPVCLPTGRPLPDGSPCSGGSCQGGACVPGPGVTGFRAITYWPDAGPTAPVVPSDVYWIGAYWPDAGGAFYSGWMDWDGSLSVPGVPEGPYVLAFSRGLTYFVETDARFVDLGEDVIGRPGLTRAASPTPVTISLDGLLPWQSFDFVQLVSGNTGMVATPFGGAAIPVGSTSFAGSFDWRNQMLLDAAQGDVAVLFQGANAPVPGTTLTCRAASRWGEALPATLLDGVQGQGLSVALQDPPAFAPFSSAWPTTVWAQHLAEVNPAAALSLQRIAVVAKPHVAPAVPSGSLPFFVPNPALLLMVRTPTGSPVPGDLSIEGVSFGRFLPPHWTEYRELRLNATVPIAMPDGSQRTYTGWIFRTDPLATAPASAEPLVTPPLDPRIAVGDVLASAFLPQAGVGTGPLLAWSPPATGAPTSYVVTILSPIPDQPTAFSVVAMALTERTSFRFPGGLLAPGTTYFATIAARSAETEQLGAPLRMQFDADFATAVTATFTP